MDAAALGARRGDVEALTLALVAAASPNPPGDERAAAAVIDAYLADIPGVRRTLVARRPERPNLVYEVGDGPRTLTLAAHLDTHPIVGTWTRAPLGERGGDRLYGRGTTDNKGAAAAMACVFRAAAEAGMQPGRRLVLVANADEEIGGADGIAALLDRYEGTLGDVVVGEPSGVAGPWEALYVAARGTSRFELSATGVRTHSSLAGREDSPSALERLDAAIAALRRALPELHREHPLYGPRGRLTVVEIAGGEGYGVVPSTARAALELRLTPGAGQLAIEQSITDAVAGLPVELAFAPGSLRWMAPSDVPADHLLVRAATAAWCDVHGSAPTLACFPGGTDARLFSDAGHAVLSGVGPGALSRAHHPDEYVTIPELDAAVRLFAAIVARHATTEEDQ